MEKGESTDFHLLPLFSSRLCVPLSFRTQVPLRTHYKFCFAVLPKGGRRACSLAAAVGKGGVQVSHGREGYFRAVPVTIPDQLFCPLPSFLLDRGFCFFNSVAIAARQLQQKGKINKILIVDWVSPAVPNEPSSPFASPEMCSLLCVWVVGIQI